MKMIKEFEQRMKEMLGEEFDAYARSFEDEPNRGFRVNPLKIDEETFFSILPFERKPSPFARYGYYLKNETGVGARPEHAQGLFYMQEPSASTAVSALDIQPGQRVLDLCAAPGSKSTQIAALLNNQGMLVANEIHPSRARILQENLSRFGCSNAIVINSDPRDVAKCFEGCFDRVLTDAPCSGEGMFRKEPAALQQWNEELVRSCATRQRHILDCAIRCLKPGGLLVYSTCTFAKEENEDNVAWILSTYEDMELEDTGLICGRKGYDPEGKTRRVFPMDGGEGHFVARFRKKGEAVDVTLPVMKSEPIPKEAQTFLNNFLKKQYPYMYMHQSRVYGGVFPFFDVRPCRLIRHQVFLGEMKNGRFEPAFDMVQSTYTEFTHTAEISQDQALQMLKGLTLPVKCEKGYVTVTLHGIPFGLGKSDGTIIKNKLPKSLRQR